MSKKSQIWKVYNSVGKEIEVVVFPRDKTAEEVKKNLIKKGYSSNIVVFLEEERVTS